jgi:hypothetical protein
MRMQLVTSYQGRPFCHTCKGSLEVPAGFVQPQLQGPDAPPHDVRLKMGATLQPGKGTHKIGLFEKLLRPASREHRLACSRSRPGVGAAVKLLLLVLAHGNRILPRSSTLVHRTPATRAAGVQGFMGGSVIGDNP